MGRIIHDKVIILILTVFMMVTLSFTSDFSLVDTKMIAGLLLLVLFLALSIVVKKDVYLYVVTALCIIAYFAGFKEIAVAFPALSQWSFCVESRKCFYKLIVPLCLAAVTFTMSLDKVFCILGLIIVSSYIACSAMLTQEERDDLIRKFDDARDDAIRERQRRRSAIDSSENDIYLATLQERNRIAREIHDNVGHILTRSIVQMKAINVMNKDDKLKPYLESVDESINNAMTSIRKSVHELHDDSIDLSVGLNDLIKTLDTKFDAKLITSIESPTSSEFKKAVLGIVKEALTNISKYSNGDKVRVEVVENNTFWRVYIHDNGRNERKDYSSDDYYGTGIGIENIMQRARSINGTASIFSDEKGFTVLVTVPKEDNDD